MLNIIGKKKGSEYKKCKSRIILKNGADMEYSNLLIRYCLLIIAYLEITQKNISAL